MTKQELTERMSLELAQRAAASKPEEPTPSAQQLQHRFLKGLEEAQAKKAVTNSHKTPPKGYPENEGEYGDPANHKYPIDKEHIRAAVSYFNHPGEREKGGYSEEQWSSIGHRIASAANRLIGEGHHYGDGKISTEGEQTKKGADTAHPVGSEEPDNEKPSEDKPEEAKPSAKSIQAQLPLWINGQICAVPMTISNGPVPLESLNLGQALTLSGASSVATSGYIQATGTVVLPWVNASAPSMPTGPVTESSTGLSATEQVTDDDISAAAFTRSVMSFLNGEVK